MTRFTESEFEYMMIQRSNEAKTSDKFAHISRPKKCAGCNYVNSRDCIGICAKELDSLRQRSSKFHKIKDFGNSYMRSTNDPLDGSG